MISVEERAWEEEALDSFDVCVPLEIFLPSGGAEAECLSYSCILPQAKAFMRLYGASPMTEDALRFAAREIGPIMREYGFAVTDDCWYGVREYILTPEDSLNEGLLRPEAYAVESLSDIEGLINLTTKPIYEDGETEETAIICRVDDRIVAFAVQNDLMPADGSVEMTVECAAAYRGQGYASACAATLVKELRSEGTPARYHCRESNLASIRVAEKVGFRLLGVRYSYVFYREGAR